MFFRIRLMMANNICTSSKIFVLLCFMLLHAILQVKFTYTSKETSTTNLLLSGPENCPDVPPLTDAEQFFDYLEVKNSSCKNMISIGGRPMSLEKPLIDGDKKVCIDSPPYAIEEGNCNILSFGIGEDWSFDDAMGERGCKVYSFDPTVDFPDHTRSPNIKFFKRGIGAPYDYEDYPKKVDKYENILHSIGLLNSVIDYVKMDVEGAEIEFFGDVFQSSFYLLKKIKQIGFEIHTQKFYGDIAHKVSFQKLWDIFHKLECSGFSKAFVAANRYPGNHYTWNDKDRSTCYEMLWIQNQQEDITTTSQQ